MRLTDLLPIGATIISLAGSFLVAKVTAKNEIKKMKFQFQREDSETLKTYFSDVVATVNTFSTSLFPKNQAAALKALGNFSAICPPNMRESYNMLTKKIRQFDLSNDAYYSNQVKATELNKLLAVFESEWASFNSGKKGN